MADEDLRALERTWAEGAGDLGSGDAFFRALERAGADVGRLLEVRLQVLRAHVSAAGLDASTLSPLPEVDPLAASLTVGAEDALDAWRGLRSRVDSTGAYPVIAGAQRGWEEEALEVLREQAWLHAPDELIGLSQSFQPAAFGASDVEGTETWTPYPVSPFELTAPTEPVCLALLPTRHPWHAAAYLWFGSDEDWPPDRRPVSTMEHVVRHRQWFERYGAEPVSLGWSWSIDMWVARPPLTQPEAMRLAAEQVVYCPLRPNEMLQGRAARLLGSTAWTFQW